MQWFQVFVAIVLNIYSNSPSRVITFLRLRGFSNHFNCILLRAVRIICSGHSNALLSDCQANLSPWMKNQLNRIERTLETYYWHIHLTKFKCRWTVYVSVQHNIRQLSVKSWNKIWIIDYKWLIYSNLNHPSGKRYKKLNHTIQMSKHFSWWR